MGKIPEVHLGKSTRPMPLTSLLVPRPLSTENFVAVIGLVLESVVTSNSWNGFLLQLKDHSMYQDLRPPSLMVLPQTLWLLLIQAEPVKRYSSYFP